ncbi:MAG: type II toxin-antitoxin system VapC family toxin [Gammaproteobacteria bacterium]
MTLIDTDVVVWYMRGSSRAANALHKLDEFAISAVTYMELLQGMRNKEEIRVLRATLKNWDTPILAISEEISGKAVAYIEQYFLSHSLRLADALIGATATVNGLILMTGNLRHYRVLPDLVLQRFRPG